MYNLKLFDTPTKWSKVLAFLTVRNSLILFWTGLILNNINNINYAKYINKGYFIGSGAVESANRYVLQERLKLPGMRWETTNGQAVLSLMAKLKSGLWEKDVVKASYRHFGVRPPHSFRLLGGENLTQGDQISRIGNR